MENNQLAAQFLLRKDICFLNFGSFGACPKPVFERYQQYQLELEQEPVQFITATGVAYLKNARMALADFLHCNADDLVYVANPSYAVNIVAKNLHLNAGDEILTTNLEYGACDRTWKYYCKKMGAHYVRQPIGLPLTTKAQFVEDFFKGYTNKTKMVFISHLTSSTGLRLPVEDICKRAKELGLLTFVDGAHAPAQVPLNLSTLQADIYTGACHKWMMTPKGSSFLYVNKAQQHWMDPLVISWGYESSSPSHSQFLDYHQTQGTRDFSPFLCIPKAIQFMEDNDWHRVSANCRKMVMDNAPRFTQLMGATPLAPLHEDFIAQLYSIPINSKDPVALYRHLFDHYKIEVPVMVHDDKVFIRYSIQAFNTQADLDRLYMALEEILRERKDLLG